MRRTPGVVACAAALALVAGCGGTPPTADEQATWRGAPGGAGPTTTTPYASPTSTGPVVGNATEQLVRNFAQAFFTFDTPANGFGGSRWATTMAGYMAPEARWQVSGSRMLAWWAAALTAGANATNPTITTCTKVWQRADGYSMWRVKGTHTLVDAEDGTTIGTFPFAVDVAVNPGGRVVAVGRVSVANNEARGWRPPANPGATGNEARNNGAPTAPDPSPSAGYSSSVPSAPVVPPPGG